MSLTKCTCDCGCEKGTEYDICADCTNEKHEGKSDMTLDEIMNSDMAKRRIKCLAKENDVSIEVAETLFKSTVKQML